MNIVSSCESLMDKMNVSTATRVFGRSGVGVDVELPYTWHSGERWIDYQQHAHSRQMNSLTESHAQMIIGVS